MGAKAVCYIYWNKCTFCLDKPFAFNLGDLIQTHQEMIEVSQGFAWAVELAPFNNRLGQILAQATLMVKTGQPCVSGLCKGLFIVQSDLFCG